ncbi:MAG: ABC transporter permease subunit [Chloroflexi bacterium]|nr:ABC transporter permease subunit [Chloroflexota bacterium]
MHEIADAFVIAIKMIFTGDPEVYAITARTLEISISSTLIGALLFIPLGCLIYFNNFWGKRTLISIIQTCYSLPTVFVGLLVFLAFSRAGPLGFFGIMFTPQVMVIGQVVLIAPIITGLTISALSGVSPAIRETAVSLGATRFQAVWLVLKEARYAVLTAILVGFGRAISEVGLAIMVGGNIRGFTRVLTTAMALETQMGNIELSMALGIILIVLALIITVLANKFVKGKEADAAQSRAPTA